MSHECPDCGMECYCDGDDTGGLPQPLDCPHRIRHNDEDEDDYDECDDEE
jgi:hypothetical protein